MSRQLHHERTRRQNVLCYGGNWRKQSTFESSTKRVKTGCKTGTIQKLSKDSVAGSVLVVLVPVF